MDVLILSQKNLQELSKLDKLSADQISKLCRTFLQSVLTGSTGKAVDDKWAGVYNAMGTLLIEAAKTNSNELQVRQILQEQGLLNAPADTVVNFYTQNKETLRTYLNRFGISFPHIVDIKWRLDYSIRSKTLGKENIPMFHIALQVAANSTTTTSSSSNTNNVHTDITEVTFLATLEELQDLLSKVKDAIKQVDRVLKADA